MMTLMNFYSLPLLVAGSFDVIARMRLHRVTVPLHNALRFESSRPLCCMCWAVLWISSCHVCVFAGFHPHGTAQTWTKLNRTGCQEQEQVRQQGEHVKRPDAFLSGDSYWVRQLVPAREVSKCEMRLFCIKASVVKGAESCRDRFVTGRSVFWNASWENLTNLSSFSNFTVSVPWSKALCTPGVAQECKGCSEQVTGEKCDMDTKQGAGKSSVRSGNKKSVKIKKHHCVLSSLQTKRRRRRKKKVLTFKMSVQTLYLLPVLIW